MSPAKHVRHIRIMTPDPSASSSSGRHTFDFRSITFEGMHQFHSKFTKGFQGRKCFKCLTKVQKGN